jgi:predicted transcriptional regulator
VMSVIEAGMQSAAEGRLASPNYTEAERSAWRQIVR